MPSAQADLPSLKGAYLGNTWLNIEQQIPMQNGQSQNARSIPLQVGRYV
jgi:hypothetical protein